MPLFGAIYYFVASLIFLGASRGSRISFSRILLALAVAIVWPIAIPAIGCYAIGKAASAAFPRI